MDASLPAGNSTTDSNLKQILAQNMLPALTQCFGIVVLGYIFGRSKILNEHGTKGLCLFVQNLSLPALIFTSLATLSPSNVNWQFIAAILVSKIIVFVFIAIITMILTKPIHLGKSGIYAIAATQSNDLALGYPLMTSLYKSTHPLFPSILYIIVPIQLLILNPVGFFLLETYKRRSDPQYSREHSLCHIFKGIIKNPIILTTVIGIIWNLVFHHYIPPVISQLMESLGSVFSPLALFLLGHSMSCGVNAVKGYFSLTPAIIVLMKILALPLLLQQISAYFLNNASDTDIRDLSSLGFLYGTLPTAPTVFIFAKQYDISVNIIASVTVYSTLFSAPLMLTSATMISLEQSGFQNMKYYFQEAITYTSVINVLCCLFLLGAFVIKKKWRDICSIVIIYVVCAQLLMSSSGILFFFHHGSNIHFSNAQYILSLGGLFLTRLFAVFLGFLIFLLQTRSLCYVLRHKLFIYLGFAVPFAIALSITFPLMQFAFEESWNLDFQFNREQVVVVLVVTLVAFTFTIAFLILQHKYMKRDNSEEENVAAIVNVRQQSLHNEQQYKSDDDDDSDLEPRSSTNHGFPSDIEDVAHEFGKIACSIQEQIKRQKKFYKHTCDSRYDCTAERRVQCSSQIESYTENIRDLNIDINKQYVRYVILLLSLSSSMLVSIMVCTSCLITKAPSGIRTELQFLDIILSYGQGIVCFVLFGLNGITNSIRRRCSLRTNTNNQHATLSDQESLIPQPINN